MKKLMVLVLFFFGGCGSYSFFYIEQANPCKKEGHKLLIRIENREGMRHVCEILSLCDCRAELRLKNPELKFCFKKAEQDKDCLNTEILSIPVKKVNPDELYKNLENLIPCRYCGVYLQPAPDDYEAGGGGGHKGTGASVHVKVKYFHYCPHCLKDYR